MEMDRGHFGWMNSLWRESPAQWAEMCLRGQVWGSPEKPALSILCNPSFLSQSIWGCHNKPPETGSFIKKRDLFLMVLEPEKPNMKAPASGKGPEQAEDEP